MIFLRSLVFNIVFYINLIVLMLVGVPRLFFGRFAAMAHARLWGRSSIYWLTLICGTKVEFRGLDKIPQGACIIASKHQSIFETFALLTHSPDFTYAVKRELRFIPLFGWYLTGTEQISIHRGKGAAAMAQLLRAARTAFKEGRQLLIFPEGTRRPAGAPPAYKYGVAQVYTASGVPCVPVALNAGLFWARRSFLRRPGTLVVEYLDPIAPGLDRQTFFNLLQERIETASNRLMDEAIAERPELAEVRARGRARA
jgi:1-acyl-sn-glycerol-3-phosphate acyltransferase